MILQVGSFGFRISRIRASVSDNAFILITRVIRYAAKAPDELILSPEKLPLATTDVEGKIL
jgi:hypothetical protein